MIDTNVLISGLLFSRSSAALAADKAVENCTLISSDAYIEELRDVVSRRKFDAYANPTLRRETMEILIRAMRRISISARFTVCRDPKDDKILDLAVSGAADFIITGDKDLLALHPFRNISILTPLAYLEL